MKNRVELRLHNFKTNEIIPVLTEDEACQAIVDLSLKDHEYQITQQTFEIETLDFSHTLSMWKNKKKQKKDVEAEVIKGAPIVITGEVIG